MNIKDIFNMSCFEIILTLAASIAIGMGISSIFVYFLDVETTIIIVRFFTPLVWTGIAFWVINRFYFRR